MKHVTDRNNSTRRLMFFGVCLGMIGLGISSLILFSVFRTGQESTYQQRLPHFTQQRDIESYTLQMSRSIGASETFRILDTVALFPTIDKHAIGHVVGTMLYQEKGAKALMECPQSYLNSCFHAVIAGIFVEKGKEAMTIMKDTCRGYQSDEAALSRCFHGLGHGVLIVSGYDIEKSLGMCQDMNYSSQTLPFRECIGGVFMELLSVEQHDPAAHDRALDKLSHQDDTMYPCSSTSLNAQEKLDCYYYVPMVILGRVAGFASIRSHTTEQMKLAIQSCLGAQTQEETDICLSGFGGQFVTSGIKEDRKMVQTIDTKKFSWVMSQCALAGENGAVLTCIKGAVASILWGTNRIVPADDAAIEFCTTALPGVLQDQCFFHLISQFFSRSVRRDVETWCKKLPVRYRSECLTGSLIAK